MLKNKSASDRRTLVQQDVKLALRGIALAGWFDIKVLSLAFRFSLLSAASEADIVSDVCKSGRAAVLRRFIRVRGTGEILSKSMVCGVRR